MNRSSILGIILKVLGLQLINTSFVYIPQFVTQLSFILQNKYTGGDSFSKIHLSSILSICVIVIGGLLFLNAIPNFLSNFWSYVVMRKELPHDKLSREFSYLIIYGAKIVIGIAMMIYQKTIVSWIEWKRKS